MSEERIKAPAGYRIIKEGASSILIPENNSVFYNPVQEFNRDLSVAVIDLFRTLCHDALIIVDALTASGFRAIRYAHQISKVTKIIANDLDPNAIQVVRDNIQFNQIPNGLIHPSVSDASFLMNTLHNQNEKVHVIDLDPYGSAAMFFDSAVQCIADGGLLCVTCTDMPVLCGVYPGACYSRYQGMGLHTEYSHEMAIRLVLSSIEFSANKYQKHIVPLLSAKIDFYVRVFVRVFKCAAEAQLSSSKKSLVYGCTKCKSFQFQALGLVKNDRIVCPTLLAPESCPECGGRLQVGGPIWTAPIHHKEFIGKLVDKVQETPALNTIKRLRGLLCLLSEEVDSPLYMTVPQLARTLRCPQPPLHLVKSSLLNAGYSVSISHCNPLGIKTNAPVSFLWDMIRAWAETRGTPQTAHPGIDFSVHPESKTKKRDLARFPVNPPNWGPLSRAKAL